MTDTDKKAVAAITFNDNRSMSVDIEGVTSIQGGQPMDLGDGEAWFREFIIRTDRGSVAIQLLSDDAEKLKFESTETTD